MIAQSIVREVLRLLAEGELSQRKIARRVGISRSSVGLIALGRRPDYADRPPPEEDVPVGPPHRCPQCGGMVYGRCRVCEIRALPATSGPSPDGDASPQLDLGSEHQARYEEMRRRRAEQDRIDPRRATTAVSCNSCVPPQDLPPPCPMQEPTVPQDAGVGSKSLSDNLNPRSPSPRPLRGARRGPG